MQNNFNLQKEIKDKTTEKFHTLKKDDTKYFIAEDKLGNKKLYLGKKTPSIKALLLEKKVLAPMVSKLSMKVLILLYQIR